MHFTLTIDTARWRAHQRTVQEEFPGLVPVCKGNGYGFGQERLAEEASRLGARTIAVGTPYEAEQVLDVFDGDVLCLTPHRPWEQPESLPRRVIRTVTTGAAVRRLAGTRTVIKLRSSMNRHGFTREEIATLASDRRDVRCEDFSLHLPLRGPRAPQPVTEVADWIEGLHAVGLPPRTFYVSHLSAGELALLRRKYPDTEFRFRVGSRLWLGARYATEHRGTVLAVVRVSAGERFGELQRRADSDGHLVLVAGGTAHGIGLRAPRHQSAVMPRYRYMVGEIRGAAGRHLSPFLHAGQRCRFAEPPYLQESLLFLPSHQPPPRVGEDLVAQVRYTTTRVDRILDTALLPEG